MSVSFPVGSSSPEDKYSKLPDTFQVSSSQRKMMINPSTRQAVPLSSSSSRFPNPVPISSVPPLERRPQNPQFINQSNNGRPTMPHMQSSFVEVQSIAFIETMEENKDMSWCQDSLQELLDFPVMESVQPVRVENTPVALTSINHSEKTVWTEWDPMLSIDDDINQYWPDLPVTNNSNSVNTKPEVIKQSINTTAQHPQNYQRHSVPAHSGEVLSGPDPSSAAPPTKSRMRWTQELHEAFVDAVSKLGGGERATPKGILTLMKVPSLTIYHVKSHLQKYRTARFKPELSEGVSETKTLCEEVKSEEIKTSMGITEALRLQVELQKHLHEQLETQRKLQLQIEEHGKYLHHLFEQSKSMGNKTNKASPSSNPDESPSSPSSNSSLKHSRNGKTKTTRHPKTGIETANAESTLNENFRDSTRKHKAQETTATSNKSVSDLPATKRAKSGEWKRL